MAWGIAMLDFAPYMTELIARREISIPPAPTTAIRMRRLVEGARYSQAELIDVIAADQTLTVALLQAANQQLVPPAPPITSVEQAVRRMGALQLGQMALAFSTASSVQPAGPLAPLHLLAWRRALVSGFLARTLAEKRGQSSADAFGCGLLHDFGWIVALACLEQLLAQHPKEGRRPPAAWNELVDQFHILLGHIAATSWGLPPLIADTILYHHAPSAAPAASRALVDIVAATDAVVALLEERAAVEAEDLARLPGVSAAEAAALTAVLPEITREVSEFFALLPAPAESAPSKVQGPAQALRGRVVPVRWAGHFAHGNGTLPVTVVGVAAEGVVLMCAQPPRENYIGRLRIAAGETTINLCVTPAVVAAAGDAHRVEARLYGLGGDARRAWDRLYADVTAATPR